MHDLGLKTSIQTFDAFVRCTLIGNQPWPQFQNGIRERSIEAGKIDCTNVKNVRCILNFVGTSYGISAIKILIAFMWARFPSGCDIFQRVVPNFSDFILWLHTLNQ